jgi:hypothetical protein
MKLNLILFGQPLLNEINKLHGKNPPGVIHQRLL